MSYTESERKPSLAPEFVICTGSRLAMSPVFAYVIVPPGWMSEGGAVVGDEVTLPMPTLIWVTALFGAAVTVDFFVVVAVVFLAVVVVTPATVVDVPPAVVAVVSPVTAVVVVSAAAAAVVVVLADFLLVPPPHAAATRPAATTTVMAFQCLATLDRLACA